MRTTDERNAAAELARRIEPKLVEPAEVDEAKRPPEDRPPGFITEVFSQAPASVEKAAELTHADWDLISKALEHYAQCGKA